MDYSLTIWSIASFVETRIEADINYDELEKKVGFSYRHLRETFKESTGISLSKYILSRRIAHAGFDIVHTEQSLTDISGTYLFSSYDAFTRAFKRVTSMSPSQFRKESCKVGRRRLIMGIYGPMIYREDELFLLQHPILEVEENMKRLEKKDDSCVLYGVPKVAYTYEECTPFPTALKACLNYMGQQVDYSYLMAATGAAFRLRWNLDFWDGGNVDIMRVYEDPYKAFERAFAAVGRSYKILTRQDGDKEAFRELIIGEIDQGRPVIALGIIGPPEACVIAGYQDNGEKLLGWNCFQDNREFNRGVTYDPSGYFITDRWWNDETKGLITIGEEEGEVESLKTIARHAIDIMTKTRIIQRNPSTSDEYTTIAGGQDAYDAWANAIGDDREFSTDAILPVLIERLMCQSDAQVMIAEGRSYAACFVDYIGKMHPDLLVECTKVAGLFRQEAKCAMDMNEVKGGFDQDEKAIKHFANPDVRKKIIPLIQSAKGFDMKAREGLEDIISKM